MWRTVTSLHSAKYGFVLGVKYKAPLYTISVRAFCTTQITNNTTTTALTTDATTTATTTTATTPLDTRTQITEKLVSMKKYIEAGKKITHRQYDEVWATVRGNLDDWMLLVKTAAEGGYIDRHKLDQFLHATNNPSHVLFVFDILTKNPFVMDHKLKQNLISKMKRTNATPEQIDTAIKLRPDLSVQNQNNQFKENKQDKSTSDNTQSNFLLQKNNHSTSDKTLHKDLEQIYNLSNIGNKANLATFYKMFSEKHPDYIPDLMTFTRIAHALGPPVNNWPLTWALVKSVLTGDVPRDVMFYNVALRALMYCDEGDDADLRIARELMEKLRADKIKPNKETYVALIDVYFRNGRVKQGLYLTEDMKADGIVMDRVLLSRFVKQLVASNEPELALHTLMEYGSDLKIKRQLFTFIEEAFSRLGNYARALEVREISNRRKENELGGELSKAVKQVKRSEKETYPHRYALRVIGIISKMLESMAAKDGAKPNAEDDAEDDADEDADEDAEEEAEEEEEGAGKDAEKEEVEVEEYTDEQIVAAEGLDLMDRAELYAYRVRLRLGCKHKHKHKHNDAAQKDYMVLVEDNSIQTIDPITSAHFLTYLARRSASEAMEFLQTHQNRIRPNPIIMHGLIRGMLQGPGQWAVGQVENAVDYAEKHDIMLPKATLDLLATYYVVTQYEETRSIMKKLTARGVLDDLSFKHMVKRCSMKKKLSQAQGIVSHMAHKMVVPLSVHNEMLNTLMLHRQVEQALQYFEDMRKSFSIPNIRTYEALVRGFIINDRVSDALAIWGDLMHQSSPFPPSVEIFSQLVFKLCDLHQGALILRILRDIRSKHVVPHRGSYERIMRCALQDNYPEAELEWIRHQAALDGYKYIEERGEFHRVKQVS